MWAKILVFSLLDSKMKTHFNKKKKNSVVPFYLAGARTFILSSNCHYTYWKDRHVVRNGSVLGGHPTPTKCSPLRVVSQ